MKTHRLARVAEVVREVASETILYELRDPRVKMVTVTRAEVSGDLQHAKVYVSVMGTQKEQELTMHGLRHAAGFIQSRLASRLQTRFTPVLQFVLDQGVKHSIEVTRLINEALAQSAPPASLDPGGSPPDETPQEADPADGSAAQAPAERLGKEEG
jgi:ribosome-binding factor A